MAHITLLAYPHCSMSSIIGPVDALAMAKAMYAGKAGLTMQQGDAGDSAEVSEGVAVGQGYVTISTIDGSIQASRAQQAYAQQRLAGLGQ